jgi:epoxyqueuosine reductase QueG
MIISINKIIFASPRSSAMLTSVPPTTPSIRSKITREARKLGADLIGFASVSRWAEYDEVLPEYRPQAIWSKAETVIVLGVPMLLPIIESTPSINYTAMYDTTNVLLDQMAYRLAVYLNNLGHASVFMPRDGYGSLDILLKKMPACFSQVFAGKYAGLGTIGYSHNLINPKYGPRARYVSVLTQAKLKGDPVLTNDLCKKCEVCKRLCPSQAFTTRPDTIIADMDTAGCTRYHQKLLAEKRWPCGVCAKVCPIGEDRKLYDSRSIGVYLKEHEAIRQDPNDPRFRHLVHLRTHGSDGDGNC